jgi:putative phosphoesterase
MKIAFISDIHGNALALDAVLHDIKSQEIDKIYVLGDLCYRGPEPKRSLDLIRALDTEVIKGNADEWVVRGILDGEVPSKVIEMMNEERQWTVSKLEQTDIDYLKALPTQISCKFNNIEIFGFHATPESMFDVVLPHEDDAALETRLMQSTNAQINIYAHIHKPYIRYINGKIIMNIGSVGLPFDGMTKASYGIVEVEDDGFETSIRRISYDIEKVVELYKEGKYPNAEKMIDVIRTARL